MPLTAASTAVLGLVTARARAAAPFGANITSSTSFDRWKAKVDSDKEPRAGNTANDRFVIVYSNREEMEMPKSELLTHLTETNSKLQDDSRWQLREKLTPREILARISGV